MKILAVTGGIGSGKSTVAHILKKRGFSIIDADKIAHEITEKEQKAYDDILRLFGDSILDTKKNIDRKRLAGIVFNDTFKLQQLNKITHHYIFEEMRVQINTLQKKNYDICMDVPLLFQCDFPLQYDASIAVLAPLAVRLERIMKRDDCTKTEAEQRIQNQLTDKEFKTFADFIINNQSNEESLEQQIEAILRKIKEGSYVKKKIPKKT